MGRWIAIAALLGATGVVLGAFGAHGLSGRLSEEDLRVWHTAVQYQLLHAVALLALAPIAAARSVFWPGILFTAGVLLFSGSLYLLALGHWRWLGPVTPLGGLCLIAGWLSLLTLARP
jgi:uncharacterized membrane protein YgdD (TMEM256/DUF423 family)